MVYLTLFFVAFASATLLPMGSEALLIYDIHEGYVVWLLWLIASVGNTLGSLVNYWLGLKGEAYLEKRGYLSKEKMARASRSFGKYGGWTLLLSWMPIIGDPLTFIAGVLRYELKWFVAIVAAAKPARYGVLALIFTP
ncbi:YqaA family protein [Sulfurovum sp.]|jgi:membrane protein YqaA with SNARE-associated domain|uniref:YqaA family protein n=1 Tax=Sulfurovum sp. TaxID=1969726 RepID=UPI002A35B255|nr:YqaA family protein [Sulfurovum sp.]MDY0403502.1 YqaA family protein [Sulfurovum sp.]